MGRTVVVGDIHGCFDELLELLKVVDLRPDDVLVAAGDIVDRGPSPVAVVDFLRSRPHTFVVMGNHERKHVRAVFSYAQEITRLQMGASYGDAVAWMATLPYYFENEDVRVVHAALLGGIPLTEQREEILCGSTRGEKELATLFPDGYWQDHYRDAKPVAFGHHVVGAWPQVWADRIYGLDTGACHGGTLSALCVPDFTLHSVPAHADYWSIVRREWQLPVLKAKPWLDYTWPELQATAARFSTAGPWVTAVQDWATRLRALFPALAVAAHRLADSLGPDELRRHPAAPVLFQARHGRLDLARQCPTPRRSAGLATALGVATPPFPD